MIREGTIVEWIWGNGKANGEVVEIFHENIEKTIDGEKVKREASKDCPIYLIMQEDGQRVLKSASELSRKDD